MGEGVEKQELLPRLDVYLKACEIYTEGDKRLWESQNKSVEEYRAATMDEDNLEFREWQVLFLQRLLLDLNQNLDSLTTAVVQFTGVRDGRIHEFQIKLSSTFSIVFSVDYVLDQFGFSINVRREDDDPIISSMSGLSADFNESADQLRDFGVGMSGVWQGKGSVQGQAAEILDPKYGQIMERLYKTIKHLHPDKWPSSEV